MAYPSVASDFLISRLHVAEKDFFFPNNLQTRKLLKGGKFLPQFDC